MMQISPRKKEKLKKYLKVKKYPWEYEKKLWKKVEKYLPYFSYTPWVQCICICNSLAMNACHENSDIDLFVITRKNRLWTTRIYLTLVTSILWLRKTSKKHAGQFCLSFFVTEDIKDFWDISIKNDIYLSYWTQTLTPVINKNNTFEKFLRENNLLESRKKTIVWKKNWNKKQKSCFMTLWDIWEKLLEKIFFPKTLRSYERLWKPFWVIISDKMLKFHDKDKRKEVRDIIL